MNKIYLTWQHVHDHVQTIIDQMNQINWQPKLVVGIARGGLVPAVMLSHQLDIQMNTVTISLRDIRVDNDTHMRNITDWSKCGFNVLIVDDINDTGETIQTVAKLIGDTSHVKIATLVNNQSSQTTVDFAGMQINKQLEPSWIVFPWEKDQ